MPIIIPDISPKPCAECGMGGVHHAAERWGLWFDFFLNPVMRVFDTLARPLMPMLDRWTNGIARPATFLLFKTGLAVKVTELDERATETTMALWNEARKRGIHMYEVRILGLPRKFFIARHKGSTLAFEGLPRPARRQKSLLWVDDKSKMKRRFLKAGFPVPKGGLARTETKALRIFHGLQKPIIVKPHEGSGGRHTTVHIETAEELVKAFWNAREVAPFAIVEEELRGPVFRATLIDKKLAAVLRRDPPCVTGDGVSTIQKLVAKENKHPLRRGPVFAEIRLDIPEADRELKRQNKTPESVPKRGETVRLHFKVNWGVGGTSWDVSEETHPENKKLFESIGDYLGEDVVGIDFMIEDISKPWQEQKRCGVIECNSLPLIGNHHFPYKGPVKNVAGAVWDMMYPDSAK